MAFQPQRKYSLEEYLELDGKSEEKLEFWGGNVWSMSGASIGHNTIVRNLIVGLDAKLRDKGCSVFGSDLRVKVPAYMPYRYPDVTALCGAIDVEQIGGVDTLVNPQLIIEVLSESTEGFDRGDKFSYYKSIASFSEYLLVAQHRPHVSRFVKQGDGFWINSEFNDLADTVELTSVGAVLSLSDIYSGVSFTDEPSDNGFVLPRSS